MYGATGYWLHRQEEKQWGRSTRALDVHLWPWKGPLLDEQWRADGWLLRVGPSHTFLIGSPPLASHEPVALYLYSSSSHHLFVILWGVLTLKVKAPHSSEMLGTTSHGDKASYQKTRLFRSTTWSLTCFNLCYFKKEPGWRTGVLERRKVSYPCLDLNHRSFTF